MADGGNEEDANDLLIGDYKSFYNDMHQLINNKQYSDATFLFSDGTEICGHKCILASRCEYFKDLFENHDDGDKHMIDDITAEYFQLLLEFIYTNCCRGLKYENVFDILTSADKIGLHSVMEICENFLLTKLSITKACKIVEAAVAFGLEKLKRELILYFEGHTMDIFVQDSFKELSPRTFAYILQSDNLYIDEMEIYALVREWSTVQSVALGIPVKEFAKEVALCIRLSLLTAEELTRIESENDDQLIPVEQFSRAWKHLALKNPSGESVDTTPRRGTRKRNFISS